jgi:hypothetical protein
MRPVNDRLPATGLDSLRRALGSRFYFALVVLVVCDLVFSAIFLIFWSRTLVSSQLEVFFLVQVITTLLVLVGTTIGIVQTSLEDHNELNGSASALRWQLYSIFEQLAIEFDSLVLAKVSSLQLSGEEELKIREQRERINRLIMNKAQNIMPYALELDPDDGRTVTRHEGTMDLLRRAFTYSGIVGLSGLSVVVIGGLLTWLFRYLIATHVRVEILLIAFLFAAPTGLLMILVSMAALFRMKARAIYALIKNFGNALGMVILTIGELLLVAVVLLRFPISTQTRSVRVFIAHNGTWLGYVVVGSAALLVSAFILSFAVQYVGCRHKRLSFPVTIARRGSSVARPSEAHVTCLECGREFVYDWKLMKIMSHSEYGKGTLAARKEVTASANDQG